MIKSKTNSERSSLDDYLKQTRTWETDKVLAAEKSRRMAWRMATLALILAVASVAAVVMLTPLKTVEPFVIRVDNTTGIVDVVKTLKNSQTNYDEAVNKYFVQKYVRAREGYNRELAESNYVEVGLMSGNAEQQRYHQYFNPRNPQSPLNQYRDYAKVRISIKSVSFVNKDVALVRYIRELERAQDRPELSHWAATVTFRYVGAPMSETDRSVNPLGFQVIDYRSDPESLTATERARQLPAQPSLPAPPPEPPAQPEPAAEPAPAPVPDAPASS